VRRVRRMAAVAAMNMDVVAAAAGVSKATIYRWWPRRPYGRVIAGLLGQVLTDVAGAPRRCPGQPWREICRPLLCPAMGARCHSRNYRQHRNCCRDLTSATVANRLVLLRVFSVMSIPMGCNKFREQSRACGGGAACGFATECGVIRRSGFPS
jgi:hypothetical protein